jgi:enoyl-CoA hydratase
LAVAKVIASINEAANGNPNGFANEITRFGECFATADMVEGATAFLEKRKAAFKGA